MKLSIIIPVYNERNTLEKILERVEMVQVDGIKEKEIVLVDDFSTDGTKEILHSFNVPHYKIIFHEKNQGKGSAVKTGFGQASGDIMIIQDADLEYDPQEYPMLLKPIIDKQAEVVYGSRFLRPGQNKHIYRHGYYFVVYSMGDSTF